MARKGRKFGGRKATVGAGGLKGQKSLLQQVQQLQEEMLAAQEALKQETVEVTVGGGMVTITMTGGQEVQDVKLVPEVVDPDDIEMLQDLLVAAFNEALEQTRKLSEERMAPFTSLLQGATGGLGGLLGM